MQILCCRFTNALSIFFTDNLLMKNFAQIDLHVNHTNKSLNLNKNVLLCRKNGNGYSWYIPSTLYTEMFRLSTKSILKKSNEQIIINYRYTRGIITLKLTKLYSTAFAARFDASVNDFLVYNFEPPTRNKSDKERSLDNFSQET